MAAPSSIAHYRILSKLGEGGMGAVYRATDTKLNRDVAIKVLPEAFAQDAARMARFEREAQVLASLNHPNIAAIYGIEQGALVMELVEGPDLKGPVPIDTAIHYARQIALALEAAHEKGIVHRDLKPANIKITPEGVVKLLDFGLAKACDAASGLSGTSPTMSPTLSLAMTQAGMILGTPAYMSPEQARGKTVDKRADIWAFGVVLFELLTGIALFGGGETISDSLAAVILKEPDWKALPADAPPRVRRLLEHCLRKDPQQRLRDIGDARLALDEAEPAVAAAAGPLVAASRLRWLPWALTGFALVAAAAAWLPKKTFDPGPGAVRFGVALPEGAVPVGGPAATGAVPSPDGRNVALIAREVGAAKSSLWVRAINGPAAHRLNQTEGAILPFWSPSGQEIAFFVDNELQRVALSGGSVHRICDIPHEGALVSEGGTWNGDNVIVFGSSGEPLMRVPATGGKPKPVTVLEKDEVSHVSPQFLPDGRHLLYLARKTDPENSTIYVQELGSNKRVPVMKSLTRAVFAPPAYLLFVREGTLFAQHMDANSFQVSGEPLVVAQDVLANESNGRSSFAISQNGVLAYRDGTNVTTRQFAWYDHQGKRLGAVGDARQFGHVSLSPDGKSAAVLIGTQGKTDTWVMDLATGVLTRMTHDGRDSNQSAPAWSPDSQRLAIALQNGGIREVVVASGKVTTLLNEALLADDWTPDGRSLLCHNPEGTRLSLFTPADGAKLQTILATPHRQTEYHVSPDGRYVTYTSDEAGQGDVYAASFPSFATKRKVSAASGLYLAWAKGGKEILYRSDDGKGYMMSVDVATSPSLAAGAPKALFQWAAGTRNPNYFAVSADGQRFLILEQPPRDTGDKPEYSIVVNWLADLK